MKIAVIGCSHGELDIIYSDIAAIEQRDGIVIDLVIICGDFQAVRNANDLQCMAVPVKYRRLQTFHKYYRSEVMAPKLTLFVGGNHEASNYMQTLGFGGWVAHNIFYMGYASVVTFRGVRIAGISGIHKRFDSDCGHFERLPFDENTKRSVFHMRQSDVYKLMQLNDESSAQTQALDVMISHDWPLNIHSCGDVQYLLRRKKYFLQEVQENRLGNPLLEPLVRHLKPRHWFSAHLHVKFEALVNHTEDLSIQTRFLALDKVLPNRQYLDIIDIEPTLPSSSDCLEYDAEWLAVLQSTDKLLSIEKKCSVPHVMSKLHSVTESDINRVKELFNNDFKIPTNFEMSEPVLKDSDCDPQRLKNYTNPQTVEFCKRLGITDPMSAIIESLKPLPNPDQISISDDEEDEDEALYGKSDENPNKRHKPDDNIDGGDLFFVDKGGVDEPKGDSRDATKAQNSKPNEDIIQTNASTSGMASENAETLTKRQIKRRADKLKRQTELRQLEKMDANQRKDTKTEMSKQMKKIVAKKRHQSRREMIIDRLEWIKANLPMKSPNSEIDVISLDQLSINTESTH
ncbi:unnamed protein product [Oppiella nova]|uniref:Lariat debranching enzyme C-terminal domain-containing protein n=1 Tax=Oppiella nova TaxID=334625 RepID=A0A7R9L8T1_9ACAR|nr:unnamed protein product [Oppiella nova]CAG2159707.1 unnamed protein product [Oppiella nova]